MKRWQVWGIGAIGILIVGATGLILTSSAWFNSLASTDNRFILAVSRSVPAGASLAELEAVAGPATRTPTPDWLRKYAVEDPELFPDGWRESDKFVKYELPGPNKWTFYFQFRDGGLINYDPVAFADAINPQLVYSQPP